MSNKTVRVNSQKVVEFTPIKFKEFKEHYQVAADKCVEIFVFDGNEYLVAYATYLIEYLKHHIKEV